MSATDPVAGTGERAGVHVTLALTQLSDDQRQAARRTIAAQAIDRGDEQLLLEALGLDTIQEHR